MAWNKKDVERSVDRLKEILEPGSTVYTVFMRASKSGMTHYIKVLVAADSDIANISRDVAVVLGLGLDESIDAVKVKGAGMDMGFHVVYRLSEELFGDGYALKHRWV